MDADALTAAYLHEVRSSGARGTELIGDLATGPWLFNVYQRGVQYLTRPLFASRTELDQVHADVELVRRTLVSLPERRFGGSISAFAQAVGAEGYQLPVAELSRSDPASPQARADLYREAGRFRLMEFNMGSALGGTENADCCRAMLRHPVLAKFAAAHQLTFTDTVAEEIASLRAATGFGPGTSPVVAVADYPRSYERKYGPFINQLVAYWRGYGVDAHGCHLGQLEYRNGKVWLHGRKVDVIVRRWVFQFLLEPEAPGLLEPLLAAVGRGDVQLFIPMDMSLYGSKTALAMVSGPDGQADLSAAERAAVDRVLPWTREVVPGPVTLEDGQRTDLYEYALSHQDDLVLKPSLRYSGLGVVPGWDPRTSPQRWRQQLDEAMNSPYVLQRRIRPESELFPGPDGTLDPWLVTWGLFTMVNGFGGVFARAASVESGATVLNTSSGAWLGSCMYPAAQPPPGGQQLSTAPQEASA
jgi:hypothetical protein